MNRCVSNNISVISHNKAEGYLSIHVLIIYLIKTGFQFHQFYQLDASIVNLAESAAVCCGSLLPVFGVIVSVTFHLTCVHIILSSVWVAEWQPFGK